MKSLKDRYSGILATTWSWKTCLSEVFGVAGFVFVGCGVAALITGPKEFTGEFASAMLNSAIVGLAFGFAIFVMVSATAHNNSDQLNPAITIALCATGTVPLLQAVLNVVSQVIGAILGAALVRGVLPNDFASTSSLGANAMPDGATRGEAFLAEVVATFIATYVILEIACNPRSTVSANAPLVVGATFGVLLVVISPSSSGSLNPARTLGPAIVAAEWDDLWIWIFGPIIGALTAVPLHLLLAQVSSPDMDDPRIADRQDSVTAEDAERRGPALEAQVSRHSGSVRKGRAARPGRDGGEHV